MSLSNSRLEAAFTGSFPPSRSYKEAVSACARARQPQRAGESLACSLPARWWLTAFKRREDVEIVGTRAMYFSDGGRLDQLALTFVDHISKAFD